MLSLIMVLVSPEEPQDVAPRRRLRRAKKWLPSLVVRLIRLEIVTLARVEELTSPVVNNMKI